MTTTDDSEIIEDSGIDIRKNDLPSLEGLKSNKQEYPEQAINAMLYLLGFQVWTEPSSTKERGSQAEKLAGGLYATICINYTQPTNGGRFASFPNWPLIRAHRGAIFTSCFHSNEEFSMLEYNDPDELFDAVEYSLEAGGYLHSKPPARTTQTIDDLILHRSSVENGVE